MRNGASDVMTAGSTLSRWSSKVGPPYQDMRAERRTTLSPVSAATGMVVTSREAEAPRP